VGVSVLLIDVLTAMLCMSDTWYWESDTASNVVLARKQDCSDRSVVALLARDALGDSRVILLCTYTNNVLQDGLLAIL
jgi:hypothetical protein